MHTKRVPLWVTFDPASEDAATLAERVRERAAAYREDYRDYFEQHAEETTIPATPTRAWC